MDTTRLLRNAILAVAALAASVSGCSTGIGSGSGPTPCEATYSGVRCENMAAFAATTLGVPVGDVAAIAVVPRPTPADPRILHTTSGGPPVDMLVTLRNGTVHEVTLQCAGIGGVACQDDPRLRATTVAGSGYFDTPCWGEPPEGCATPVPSADPGARAAAVELHVDRLDIPIDHDGPYEAPVGQAVLPNGILTTTAFELVSDAWPTDVTIDGGIVWLTVRSLDHPAKAFASVYERGRVDGVERVEAVLVFTVLAHDPGAILSVRDIVVR